MATRRAFLKGLLVGAGVALVAPFRLLHTPPPISWWRAPLSPHAGRPLTLAMFHEAQIRFMETPGRRVLIGSRGLLRQYDRLLRADEIG